MLTLSALSTGASNLMRARLTSIALPCGAGLLLLAAPALANPYDDCVLQHMGNAQIEVAVNAIERACIAKTSIPVSQDEARKLLDGQTTALAGKFNVGGFTPERGLLVELKNTTSFDITELAVTIINKTTQRETTYPVSVFFGTLPPGVMLGKAPEPSASQILPSGKTIRFFVAIHEVTDISTDFPKNFSWSVTPIKGIPPN
jgi:hypothetical protein